MSGAPAGGGTRIAQGNRGTSAALGYEPELSSLFPRKRKADIYAGTQGGRRSGFALGYSQVVPPGTAETTGPAPSLTARLNKKRQEFEGLCGAANRTISNRLINRIDPI